MRANWFPAGAAVGLLLAAVPAAVVLTPGVAVAAAPAPCGGQAQITDVAGDGHHASSDVLDAWFSEPAPSQLQATIRVSAGSFEPEHTDAEINGSGFAMLFSVGGQTRYVRAIAPPANGGVLTYDYGTWNGTAFVSAGPTTGSVTLGYPGTVTIDVPAASGAVDGARILHPFVLTYDGITGGVPAWVDRAPGGVTPTDSTSFGADFLVGTCTGHIPAGSIALVQLSAARVPVGGGKVRVSGRIVPAAGGIPVSLSRHAKRNRTSRLVTQADGTFAAKVQVNETTTIQAVAGGVTSRSLDLPVRSRVSISVRHRHGVWLVSGHIAPRLPGKLQLLPVDGFTPVAQLRTKRSTYSLRIPYLEPDKYQVVWEPRGGRAGTAVSRAVRVR